MIATNILSLTSAAFNAAISSALATATGVRTISGMTQTTLTSQAKHKAATKRFGTRLASRTKRVAAKSIAAIPAEAIPYLGVGVLIADTGYELYAACESMRDLDQLYSDLGMAEETPDDVMHSVCNPL